MSFSDVDRAEHPEWLVAYLDRAVAERVVSEDVAGASFDELDRDGRFVAALSHLRVASRRCEGGPCGG